MCNLVAALVALIMLNLAEIIEGKIRNLFPDSLTTIFTHLESLKDPKSQMDVNLDREKTGSGV